MGYNFIKYKFFCIFIFMLSRVIVSAQIDEQKGFNSQFDEPEQDTLTANDSVIVKNAFFKLFTGKPGRAALYSLVLPGGGQLYNKKYWKFPLAVGIDGALAYNVWYQTGKYREYQDLYLTALNTGDDRVLSYKENRDQYRRSKEYSWLYLFVGHVLTVMDAYVDRHLMEFDISPDISYTIPGANPTIGLSLCLNFNQISNKRN